MAGFAVDGGDVIRMRIGFDVGVTGVAAKAAMDAGAELIAIDGDAVPGRVLHGFVGMAGEAVGLGARGQRQAERKQERKNQAVDSGFLRGFS